MTVFLAVGRLDEKGSALKRSFPGVKHRVDVDCQEFRWIARSPFAYWVSGRVRSLFKTLPSLRSTGRVTRMGLATADDFRFARCWWESPTGTGKPSPWHPMAKGGRAVPLYSDVPLTVLWADGGNELKAFAETTPGTTHWSRNIRSVDYYFKPGVTWPLRSRHFCPQMMAAGTIITVRGSGIFGPHMDEFSALGSSSIFDLLIRLMSGRIEHPQLNGGDLSLIPMPQVSEPNKGLLSGLAIRGWSLRRSLDTGAEVSHAFVVPGVLQVEGDGFADQVAAWAKRVARVENDLVEVQAEIDEICFELYGISEEDRRAITEGFGVTDDSETSDGSDEDTDDDDEDSGVELDPVGLGAGLVSWCVGVTAGRFDVRLATGERGWPGEPDPFDPLPVCSPGMLTGDDGLPLVEPPAGYPLRPSPVFVVDPGHRLDVTARVREVFDVVFGGQADAWWTEVGEVLDPRGGEVGSWLAKGFFDHHLKTHSKSRRKAPVLWPIGTSSGSYQVWLYAHRVTGDSLFRVLNDLIVPKLNTEEAKLTRLRQEAGPNPSASERKTIDTQEKLVSELVELREAVEGLAPLWAPDLNDGIVIVLAPLWRLFSHHKPWMRELKKHWVKLTEGDYDWAQLAMHLWPERVIPKCAEDRSLAIAHRLEDVFWQPDPNNNDKWIPRDTPTTPIDQLIEHRHNPTTKAALARMSNT